MQGSHAVLVRVAVILAGCNGAGKSGFYERYASRLYVGMPFINADRIEQELRSERELSPYDAAQEAERQRRMLMANGKSFITETVFSHPSKLQLIHDLVALGYQVDLHVIELDSADLAVARVAQRVAAGGHPVPEQKIRARFERTRRLTREAEKFATRCWVWDNSDAKHPYRKVRSSP
jgi:predicted ABC-type ATPase